MQLSKKNVKYQKTGRKINTGAMDYLVKKKKKTQLYMQSQVLFWYFYSTTSSMSLAAKAFIY